LYWVAWSMVKLSSRDCGTTVMHRKAVIAALEGRTTGQGRTRPLTQSTQTARSRHRPWRKAAPPSGRFRRRSGHWPQCGAEMRIICLHHVSTGPRIRSARCVVGANETSCVARHVVTDAPHGVTPLSREHSAVRLAAHDLTPQRIENQPSKPVPRMSSRISWPSWPRARRRCRRS
jgi:hypothetical protein